MSNMRQIGQGFMMYCNNNKQRFPRPGVAKQPEDWIYWEDEPIGTDPDRAFEKGPLMPYLGNSANREVFQCPSDDVQNRRPNVIYRFSYSANYLILKLPPISQGWIDAYPDGNGTLRLSEIVSPSDKVLMIDETAETVDDGCWAWMAKLGDGQNIISNRHMRREEQRQYLDRPEGGKGNALFADFHVEYIERKASYTPFNFDPKLKN